MKAALIRVYLIFLLLGGFGGITNGWAQAFIPDPAFRLQAYINPQVESIAVQDDGKIVVGTYLPARGYPFYDSTRKAVVRLMPDGRQDTSFHPPIQCIYQTPFFVVYNVLPVEDGKLIITGSFSTSRGSRGISLLKLMPGGDRDTSFHMDSLNGGYIQKVLRLSDGRYFFGGSLRFSGKDCHAAIIDPDGTVDTSFLRKSAHIRMSISAASEQMDHKLLVSGEYRPGGMDQDTIPTLIRLHPNGDLDTSFHTEGQGFNGLRILPYPMPGGWILTHFGLRLDNAGRIDPGFQIRSARILEIAPLPTEKIITLEYIPQSPYLSVVRRYNADGSPDTTVTPFYTRRPLGKIILQRDGKFLTVTQPMSLSPSYYTDTADGLGSVVRLTEGVTSAKKTDRNPVRVMPNPAHDAVHIQTTAQLLSVSLIDALGRTIYTTQLQGTEVVLPLQDLPAGLYQVQAETNAGILQARLVKE